MNRTRLAIAAVLSVAAIAAQADDMDRSGQFATGSTVAAPATRAQVQAQLDAYKSTGVNPWSTSYNPLASFQSQKTREQVRNEFLANRNAVNALTAEDSGSAYLAAHKPAAATSALGE